MKNKERIPRFKTQWFCLPIAMAFTLIIGAYVVNFHNSKVSTSPADWSLFASYINGMLTPILTFVNILVLLGVGQAVYDLSTEKGKHIEALKNSNCRDDDLIIQVDPNATIEDNIKDLDEHLKQIQRLFDSFHLSDEQCINDLYKLGKEVNLDSHTLKTLQNIPYYKNPFSNRMWEIHNLAVPNTMTHTKATVLQLKVNVYELMLKQSNGDTDIYEKYKIAQKALEDFCEESRLLD